MKSPQRGQNAPLAAAAIEGAGLKADGSRTRESPVKAHAVWKIAIRDGSGMQEQLTVFSGADSPLRGTMPMFRRLIVKLATPC